MSQNLLALDGGISQVVTTPNPGQQIYVSKQYVDTNNLNPYPTEWDDGERPIYDRLPRVYRVGYDFDEKYAYVYVPVGVAPVGPGTLQVQRSGGNKFLTIQSGMIVWKEGNVPLSSTIIDLELVGLQSTRYFIGYQLYVDDSPYEALYSVENYSLAGSEMNIVSSTDVIPGWRYQPSFAFSNAEDFYWSNNDSLFPSYTGDAFLSWQTEFPQSYSSIKFRCPPRTVYTGTATLYYQSCPSSLGNEKYCSAPVWIPQETVSISADSTSQFFQFDIQDPSFQYGWRVEWSDSRISIQSVLTSGTLTLFRRPVVPLTFCQLVAYPQNAVPKTTLNSVGKEVPVTTCGLAIVETNNIFEATNVTDIRETLNGEYQPVANWLTKTWDENLITLRDEVRNFPEYWMNPPSCLFQEYPELERYLITVEK